MDALLPLFPGRNGLARIEPEQAVVFLGRVDSPSVRDVDRPAARVAQSLRFGQISLAPPQGLFRPLAIRDVVVGLEDRHRASAAVPLQGPSARHHQRRTIAFVCTSSPSQRPVRSNSALISSSGAGKIVCMSW